MLILLVLALLSIFPIFWYRRTYRPAQAAVRALDKLSESLESVTKQWKPEGKTTLRHVWAPILFSTNDAVEIVAHGYWEGTPATVQFKFGDGGDVVTVCTPDRTIVRVLTNRHLAPWAGINRYEGSDATINRTFATLGVVPKMHKIGEDLYAWGEDSEIARFFGPAVLDLFHTYAREKLGAFGTEGLVVQGSEVRITWTGHVDDPKLIADLFRVLKGIADTHD